MKKRTCETNQIALKSSKKQKLQKVTPPRNNEIYPLKQNSFRTFNTPYFQAFCLHATEPLIAISSNIHHLYSVPQSVVRIYTLDGDLITILEVSSLKRIYLSATMMMILNTDGTLTRYKDFSVKDSPLNFSSFTCDMIDNIYTSPQRRGIANDGISSIYIYSPDLEYIKSFKIQLSCIRSIRILEDTMAILSRSKSIPRYYVISRYSLSKAELLQSIYLKDKHLLTQSSDLSISFDPLCNIFISGYRDTQLAVWYVCGRIRYYQPGSRYRDYLATGVEMTKSFQFIWPMNRTIRIYEDSLDIFRLCIP